MNYYFPTETDRRVSSMFDLFKHMATRDRAIELKMGFQVGYAECRMKSAAEVVSDRVNRWANQFLDQEAK